MKSDTDKHHEQIDNRFDQVINSINNLADKQERSLEKLLERLDYSDEKQRNFTLRMFTLSIAISMLSVAGAFLTLGLI